MPAGRQAGVRSFAVAPGARPAVAVPLSAPARRRLGAEAAPNPRQRALTGAKPLITRT